MKRNMKAWLNELLESEVKKPIPVLSFPAVQLMDISVRDLIASGDSQAKGMQLVAERVPAGASVSLMDLSVEAECFGSQVKVFDEEVPAIVGAVVTDEDEADKLEIPEVGSCRTGIYIDAIKKACETIKDRPVFAGVIGPYSLAGRLMDVTEIMYACYDEPETVHKVLAKATQFLINYISAYKAVGANGVMMAEPLAGLLSPELSAEFSCKYVKDIVDAVQTDNFIVIYHNCGNAVDCMIPEILSTGSAAYHFGNAVDMEDILSKMPEDIICMGNIDPASQFRNGTAESMRKSVLELLNRCSKHKNYVLSSGCDIPPLSRWENIDSFFNAAKEFYEE